MATVLTTLFWRPTKFEVELILSAIREASDLCDESGEDVAILKSLDLCFLRNAPDDQVVEIIRRSNATDPNARVGYQGVC